ncbi:MAG: FdhF/YdeP family oxidoreductase [Actinomycetota bacterium]
MTDDDLSISDQKDWAAGVPAAVHALAHGTRRMGVRRMIATLRDVNQDGGFDCPGCAWPEPNNRHIAEFCENGVKALAAEATTKRCDRTFFAAHSIDELRERSEHWLGEQGRITEPMHLAPGADRYEPITWGDANELIASELQALDSPDRAAFYTSGRTSNEAAFLLQLFARTFGTNNLPDCSNMCHESSGRALNDTIGSGKGTVQLDDIESADLIVVVGQNPGTNHPRMLGTLETAKGNGAHITVINPLAEAGLRRFKNPQRLNGLVGKGTPLADDLLQIRTNGDLAFFAAVNHLLISEQAIDREFIDEYTSGFDAFAAAAGDIDWATFTAATGFDPNVARRFAARVRQSDRIVVCWAMGLTQHSNAVATIKEVVNFLLLRGNIGRPGAGLCPVRGHSNVQGDRTMGICEHPTEEFLDALAAEFAFEPPRHHGHDVVNTIRAMRTGDVQVLFAMGGNFATATPDTDVTLAALATCRLTVQVSTKLNSSHLYTGEQAVILPPLGRTERHLVNGVEQAVTVEDSMGIVHASTGTLAPASPSLRSEVQIVCNLAERTVPTAAIPWSQFAGDHALIRDRISQVVPGFERFNERVAEPNGFVLEHAARDRRRFHTETGKAQFTVNELTFATTRGDELLLQTIRSHDQYNTTIYGLDDRYRGVRGGRRVVFVAQDDLDARGIAAGAIVDLVARSDDGVSREAPGFRAVAYDVPPGCCAAYFPETNVLVALESANDAGTPAYKSIPITLRPHRVAP